MKKYLLRLITALFVIAIIMISLFSFYFNNTTEVDPNTISYYNQLKHKLKEKGYEDRLFIVSTKRWKWHNDLLHYFNTGAAKESYHLRCKAIDVIVRDINNDGQSDKKDVLIVKGILENEIVKNNGGVGIYLASNHFFSRQMVHFDSRGYKARWNY